jgi:hypothetical protein
LVTSQFTLKENSIYKNSREGGEVGTHPKEIQGPKKKEKKRTRTHVMKEHNNQDMANTIRRVFVLRKGYYY